MYVYQHLVFGLAFIPIISLCRMVGSFKSKRKAENSAKVIAEYALTFGQVVQHMDENTDELPPELGSYHKLYVDRVAEEQASGTRYFY